MNLQMKAQSVFLPEMLDALRGQVVWKMDGCLDNNLNILYFPMNHPTLAIVTLYIYIINNIIIFLYIKSWPGPVFTDF